jgi:hypothetical protein
MTTSGDNKLGETVIAAKLARDQRELGYRERALKLYPHICGRCGREFSGRNLPELTVHHRDHNHDNNPNDGSNWELLCLYCHDNEHRQQIEAGRDGHAVSEDKTKNATHKPFANLKALLDSKKAGQ